MSKPGQGYARRVTLENLRTFLPLLAPAGQREARGDGTPRTEGSQEGSELHAAEKLFDGTPIVTKNPLRRSAKSRAPRAQRRGVDVSETPKKAASPKLADSASVSRKVDAPDALFAEIPKGGSRWNQANFSKEAFTDFFHARAGSRLTLRSVDEAGHVASEPERRGVVRKSRNFSIELAAGAGKQYPAPGRPRPIGVFIPASSGFLYMLLLPGDPSYGKARKILDKYVPSRTGRVKRKVVDGKTAQGEWPISPLWSAFAATTANK